MSKMPPKKGAEALGSLLASLQKLDQQEGSSNDKPDQSSTSQTQTISEEALEKLADRLHALVGEEFELSGEPALNEEGLPIIELMEPTTDAYNRSDFIPEPPEISVPKTQAEKITFRKARDAFIAALEEEEQANEEYTRREEETEFMKAIRQAKEKVQEIRTSENTQVNSGQLSSVATADGKLENRNKVRKNVSFAVDAKDDHGDDQSWGDVRYGRLRASKGPKSGQGIMKLEIVERMPSISSPGTSNRPVDSDDEDSNGEEGDDSLEQGDSGNESDEIGFDDAMEQREVALRYHELRQSLGKGPQGGPLGGPIDGSKEDEWDQEDVPLEANLSESSRRKPTSLFMASRLSDRTLNAILPNGLQGEIRHGKLVDNQLVANGDDDASDGELNERGKRIVGGLTKGMAIEEILAQEPLEVPPIAVNLDGTEKSPPKIERGTVIGDVKEVTERPSKPVSEGKTTKVSRFKANRMAPDS